MCTYRLIITVVGDITNSKVTEEIISLRWSEVRHTW